MKKTFVSLFFLFICLTLILLAGCQTRARIASDDGKVVETDVPEQEQIILVTYQNKEFNGKVPIYVLENLTYEEDTENLYFVAFATAKDLDASRLIANQEARIKVAESVRIYVKSKLGTSQVGDTTALDTYIERVAVSMTEAKLQGMLTTGEFWAKYRETEADGNVKEYFKYFIRKQISKEEFKNSMKNSMEENQPTENETRARDLVQDAMDKIE